MGRSVQVREHGTVAAGEHSGHPMRLGAQRAMAHRVNAAMEAMEAVRPKPLVDPGLPNADAPQLVPGDHAILPPRERRQPGIHPGSVAFSGHLRG